MVVSCPGHSKEFDPNRIFRRILVPIDFSAASRHALITACEFRCRFGSELHLFVATEPGHASALRGLGVHWGAEGAMQDAKDRLHFFAESICAGMPCVADHATFGTNLIDGIAETAQACGASLVVLGTHDRHSLLRTRVERILNSLHIPVLVLKHTEDLADRPAGAAGPAAAAADGP